MRSLVVASLLVAVVAHGPGTTVEPERYLRPLRGDILRHFEPPTTPFAAGHRGIDLAAEPGTAVRASAGGTVAFAGQVGGDLFVSIDHLDGLRTTYSFLSAVLVTKGSPVEAGSIIARSGGGHAGSERAHLHFGVRRGDEYLDPEPLLIAALRRDLSQAVRLAA